MLNIEIEKSSELVELEKRRFALEREIRRKLHSLSVEECRYLPRDLVEELVHWSASS